MPGVSTQRAVQICGATSTGDRQLRINSIGWNWGKKKKQIALQNEDLALGQRTPCILEHGDQAVFAIPISTAYGEWLQRVAAEMFKEEGPGSVDTLRGFFSTSVGKVLRVKPDEALLDRIRESLTSRQ